ncbi:2-oxoacid:acceptor oxidoreductase subunit alpha [Prosthecochloris sp.]|uniref:2-oxoacid:acceptor oxidoreductase subunit alpha n=1 Tax=Prosthecochloris sp. TaxID=290513 RepID=UPI0025E9F358|nr:2-oxoacid:acceptor oxidoreductase subunit alpha [Prosthecochloris sp.]
MHHFENDISIVFGGAAGQGVQTIAEALVRVLKRNGYYVFACTEFMSRIRGGSNSTEVRVTARKRGAYVSKIDFLVALNADAIDHLQDRIGETTLVFAEKKHLEGKDISGFIDTPIAEFAEKAGSKIFSNTVAVGIVLGLLGISIDAFSVYLSEQFATKGEDVVAKNITAAKLGYTFGKETAAEKRIEVTIDPVEEQPGELLIDGNTAVGIGTVAAGCSFISSYPMSPGTGLLTYLAHNAEDFNIVVDQAEDEIAAINAALGASYAGARSIVTTSGGGFALMEEGVSLAGVTEVPVVVHLGQRPGPATGLPTRTEQADLNLTLYAGHGEFSRVILAPGTFAQAIELMQRAFHLAEKYQTAVFVLTDQFFLDSIAAVDESDIVRLPLERYIVRTDEKYKRYSLTGDGLSPRGVPGYGDGIVKVDSHEHNESGHLTENFELRRKMVEKRLKRLEYLAEEALMPELFGAAEAKNVVVAWGSNRGVLEEVIDNFQRKDLSGLHFSQLFPLNMAVKKQLEGKHIIVLENNATGQFADLLIREFGVPVSKRILKVTGEPFSVEEVVEVLQEV